jgi:hypothetical protein
MNPPPPDNSISIHLRSLSVLFSHLCLRLSNCLFISHLPTTILYASLMRTASRCTLLARKICSVSKKQVHAWTRAAAVARGWAVWTPLRSHVTFVWDVLIPSPVNVEACLHSLPRVASLFTNVLMWVAACLLRGPLAFSIRHFVFLAETSSEQWTWKSYLRRKR